MITRRILLQAIAVAAAAGLYAPALQAQDNDRIRAAFSASGPRSADPNWTTQGADNWATEQMFEQLVRPPDGQFGQRPEDFEPYLAESWSSSEDARTWTFQLREGVQFHKGYGEMTAEDVVFTFERAMSDGTATSIYNNIESVEAVGPYEVRINLKNPDPLFLGAIVFSNNVGVVSKKAVEERGEAFQTDPIGTGPYQLERFDSEEGVYLTRFDDYWGEPAKIENIEILYIADTTARTLALMSGDVDMIEGVRAPGWVPSIQAQNPDLVFDMTAPGSFNTLFFNLTRPPLDNILVRQAIAHGINKEELVQALAPMSNISYTLNPPHYPTGFALEELPEELRYEYDPEKAKALLAEAGYPDGFSIRVNTSQREDYSSQHLILQEQLRAIGVDVDLNIMDHSAYHAENRKDLNTLPINSSSLPPIPLDVYNRYAASSAEVKNDGSGGTNYAHYGVAIPGVDEKLEEMLQATTFEDYVSTGRDVELQIQRDLPMLGLPTLSYTVVRNPRLDLGFDVEGGYARWRLDKATFVD